MSFRRHLDICDNFNPNGFVPLLLAARRVGLVRHGAARALADYPRVFQVGDRGVALIASPLGLSEALAEVAAALVTRGLIPELRGEAFAVTDHWGGTVLFQLDRGAVPFFGTRSYGVHLNGLLPDGALWVGRRSRTKKVAPGKLDNLVAGGIGAGYDAGATLIKEAGEEAGMAEALAAQARPVSAVFYRMVQAEGLRDDVLFIYDIDLSPDFVPRNTDGEFEDFQVMALTECLRLVAETDAFKFNVNLVLIDLGIRRGAIRPDHPDYLDLVAGLRGKAGQAPHRLG